MKSISYLKAAYMPKLNLLSATIWEGNWEEGVQMSPPPFLLGLLCYGKKRVRPRDNRSFSHQKCLVLLLPTDLVH